MKLASIVFAVVAFVAGLGAAFYWYKSSGFKIGPTGPKWGLAGTGSLIEPVEPELKALDLAASNIEDHEAFIEAMKSAGHLNQIAALLTAGSVTASGLSTILGAIAN